MQDQTIEKELPQRDEIHKQYTWRLEDIFATDEEWEETFQQVKKQLPVFDQFRGQLHKSADILLAAFQKRDELFQVIEKLYTYAHMRHDQDVTHPHYQGLNDRALNLYMEAIHSISFFDPEILSMSEEQIDQFLQQNEALQLYRFELAKLNKRRPHVLTDKEEALLAQAEEVMMTPSHTFGALNNADITFPKIEDEDGNLTNITHGRFIQFLESRNRRVRKEAFEAVYQAYGQLKNTFAQTLNGVVKKHNFQARVRKYNSARHAALSNNHIPETVYDQLISTVHQHLPLLHRYVRLKKRALGLKSFHTYDLYTNLVADGKISITYQEAQEILPKALRPLGEEYLSILQKAFTERWIDVYETKGKRSGAYSSGVYGTNPYILLNWQDDMINLFTLAHEFGHSAHSYYARKEQPYPYGDYTIFVAEVASTCNEALLHHYLLQTLTEPNKRLYLLNHYLEGFRATVFRQTMFAEFELLIHQKAQEGEALTPDLLNSLYYDLNKKYFGPEVELDPLIALEWARIPHFYYNFYVYQYATGYSAATSLSRQIIEQGTPAVERYLNFLKAGNSDYPIEVLKKAGVDMTSSKPIEQAFQVFSDTMDEMEQLLFN